MSGACDGVPGPFGPISRRSMVGSALLAGAAMVGAGALAAEPAAAAGRAGKRYEMKKSINLWAFPYPQKMTLVQCLQLAKDAGFDGIELNYDLESDLSPKSGTKEFNDIRRAADKIGIAISTRSNVACSNTVTSNPNRMKMRAQTSEGINSSTRREYAGKPG